MSWRLSTDPAATTEIEVRVARFQNCYGPEGTLRQAQGSGDRPRVGRWHGGASLHLR